MLLTCKKSAKPVAPIQLVLLTQFHHYNGATCFAAPLYWWNCVSSTKSIGANARKNKKNSKSVSILIRFGLLCYLDLPVISIYFVGGIGAWNYPLQSCTWKVGPALACGNTFVYKPSPLTPLAAVVLGEVLQVQPSLWESFFVYFFRELECLGHSFDYDTYFVYLRDVWILIQRESCRSKQARY